MGCASRQLAATRHIAVAEPTRPGDVNRRPAVDQALCPPRRSRWYDEDSLKLGDSFRRPLDNGMAQCDGEVVLRSPHYFKKAGPRSNLTRS